MKTKLVVVTMVLMLGLAISASAQTGIELGFQANPEFNSCETDLGLTHLWSNLSIGGICATIQEQCFQGAYFNLADCFQVRGLVSQDACQWAVKARLRYLLFNCQDCRLYAGLYGSCYKGDKCHLFKQTGFLLGGMLKPSACNVTLWGEMQFPISLCSPCNCHSSCGAQIAIGISVQLFSFSCSPVCPPSRADNNCGQNPPCQ